MNAYTKLSSNKVYMYSIEMVIGFTQRTQTVSESQAPETTDRFDIPLDVHARKISEKEFVINFIVLLGNAVVQPTNMILNTPDALFGTRNDAGFDITFTSSLTLLKATLRTPPFAVIIDDFLPEAEEFFEIGIVLPDSEDRDNFECTREEEVPPPGGFFCRHTIFIVDNDGQLIIVYKNWC